MNTLIAIFCIVILFNLVKSLFKGNSINHSELNELIESRKEYRAKSKVAYW